MLWSSVELSVTSVVGFLQGLQCLPQSKEVYHTFRPLTDTTDGTDGNQWLSEDDIAAHARDV